MPHWILRMPHSIDQKTSGRQKAETQKAEVRGDNEPVRGATTRGSLSLFPTSDFCPLPSDFCLLTPAFWRLASASCLVPSAFCCLPSAFCLLPSAFRPSTSDLCLLPSSFWRLSSALRFRLPRIVGRDELRVAL